MDTKLDYIIYPSHNLILERLMGRISVKELIFLSGKIWEDELYDKSFDGIVDIRHASIDMSRSSLESFAQLIIASESASAGRLAIIASTPFETALSYLLAEKLTKGEVASVFCTWKAVVAYLGLPKSMLAELADERAYNAMFD